MPVDNYLNLTGLTYFLNKVITNLLSVKANISDLPGTATDSVFGLVKTNANKSISLNANGQLEVGGRLGQFPTSLGLFAPDDREPRQVSDYSLLITDAKGMTLGNRALAVVSGLGVTCKSAPAGSTEYRVSNTYANRLLCKIAENGYASRDEATSKVEMTIPVVSVTINGSSYTPDSSANDSTKDIIIKTETTLNPDSAITSIRLFPIMQCYSTAHIGNGIASWGGGRNFLLGGGVTKDGSGNDNCVVSNGTYVNGNGNAVFGRHHVVRKNRGFFAGQGHDNTNATGEGVSAIGQYSNITANTMFAIGNGSNHTTRLNLLEVVKDGRVKSPGTPTESDDLTPKSYVDSAVASAGFPEFTITGNVTLSVDGGSVTSSDIKYALTADKTIGMIWGEAFIKGAGTATLTTCTTNIQVANQSQTRTIKGLINALGNTNSILPYIEIGTDGIVKIKYALTVNNTQFLFPPTIIRFSDF